MLSNINKETRKAIFISGLLLMTFFLGINFEKVQRLAGETVATIKPVKVSASQTLLAKDLKSKLDNKNFFFVNVHTPYAGEIIKTDAFIPYDEIVSNQDKLPTDKNTAIIVYCQSGNMSGQAVKTLVGMGYKNVKHLEGGIDAWKKAGFDLLDLSKIPEEVVPEKGFELPIVWGNMGPELIRLGVIDLDKFEKTVQMSEEEKKILTQGSDQKITVSTANSQFVVDMLWAYGLAQKSKVYDEGPMGKEYKKDAGSFSSTGGWSLARGKAMDHYNMHTMISLTEDQHRKVMEISKGIYRPCCGNPTSFPDCNHGMAALAAVELMVKQGLSDEEIYRNVLKLNSFWFGTTYMTTATYFARQGIDWKNVDAKEVLSAKYSSSQGAGQLVKIVGELPFSKPSKGGCGA